ncbi:MAG: hypothetical protein GY851_07270, partial [bacterium]|nr:hypothetical protein [bacterium]
MTESTEDRLTRERDEARAEVGRLRERERFLSENGPRLEVKSNLLALPPDELAERFIRLMAANVQHQHNNCRMEKAEVDASMYAAQAIRAESERDTLRATVERLESEAPAARTVTATVSAVLDEYGRDIVEVAKAVLEL